MRKYFLVMAIAFTSCVSSSETRGTGCPDNPAGKPKKFHMPKLKSGCSSTRGYAGY